LVVGSLSFPGTRVPAWVPGTAMVPGYLIPAVVSALSMSWSPGSAKPSILTSRLRPRAAVSVGISSTAVRCVPGPGAACCDGETIFPKIRGAVNAGAEALSKFCRTVGHRYVDIASSSLLKPNCTVMHNYRTLWRQMAKLCCCGVSAKFFRPDLMILLRNV